VRLPHTTFTNTPLLGGLTWAGYPHLPGRCYRQFRCCAAYATTAVYTLHVWNVRRLDVEHPMYALPSRYQTLRWLPPCAHPYCPRGYTRAPTLPPTTLPGRAAHFLPGARLPLHHAPPAGLCHLPRFRRYRLVCTFNSTRTPANVGNHTPFPVCHTCRVPHHTTLLPGRAHHRSRVLLPVGALFTFTAAGCVAHHHYAPAADYTAALPR